MSNKEYIDYKVYNITKIKNKYGYRIKLEYYDGTSSLIQKSGFKTLKEATESKNKSIADLINKTFILNDSISIKDFYTKWLEEIMRPKITAGSYDSYKNIVYNHIIPYFKGMKLTTLDKSHIQRLYNSKVEYSLSVTRGISIVIHTSLNYAVEKNYIKVNPSQGINLPKNIKKKEYRKTNINSADTLTEEQILILLEHSKGTLIYLQIMFAVLMGLRKSEINGLKYTDIDFVRRKIHIQRQLGVMPNTKLEDVPLGKYTKQEIKCKTFSSNRILNIPDILFEEILIEKAKYEKRKNRRKNDQTNTFFDLNYIICSSNGNPRSKSFHFKHWKEILKKANLPDMKFHDLRKTYCTLLLNNNFNSKAVSSLMGHATEIITVDVYGDKQQLVKDGTLELEPFLDRVLPKNTENNTNLSNDTEINKVINDITEYFLK